MLRNYFFRKVTTVVSLKLEGQSTIFYRIFQQIRINTIQFFFVVETIYENSQFGIGNSLNHVVVNCS